MKSVGILFLFLLASIKAKGLISTLENRQASPFIEDTNELNHDQILRSFVDDFVAEFASRLQKTYVPRMETKNEKLLEFLSTSCEEVQKRRKEELQLLKEFQGFQNESVSDSQGSRDPVKDFLIKILSSDIFLNRENGSLAIPANVKRILKDYIFQRLSWVAKPFTANWNSNLESSSSQNERKARMGMGDVILEGLNKFTFNGAKISEMNAGNKIDIQLDFGPVFFIPVLSRIQDTMMARAYTLYQVLIQLNFFKASPEVPTSVTMHRVVVSEPEEKDLKLVLCGDDELGTQEKEYIKILVRDLKQLKLRRFYADIIESILARLT